MSEFIKITEDNIEKEHLCCIIREKKPHPGVEKKRAWLLNRLKDGHVFLKLNEKARFLSNTNRSKRHGFRFRDGGICTFIVFGYSANIKAKVTELN